MYILLIICIIILLIIIGILYVRTSNILNKIDTMIESAINHTFLETNFTEHKLSRLESKMYRYLSFGKTSQKQLTLEKDAIKTLVSDISHQTKTPIANILLYTQLLEETPNLEKDSKNIISQIENQTEKLNFLIQSLVKISRLENGIVMVTPKSNSIRELLTSIDYFAIADAKGIYLKFNEIPDLMAVFDFKWTLEAISNIIDNAIKYTPSGGSITVTVQDYEMFVRIDISDTGIGMKEEETAKIFSRFYRSPAVRNEKGVGIGLYLSKEILTKEGGYIKVSSKLQKGSIFSVFLTKQLNLSKL